MKRKGFTLIELLAVIVILAIIALIATPMIMGVIEKARKGAAENSARYYIEGVENTIVMSMLDNKEAPTGKQVIDNNGNISDYEITVKGEKPKEGNMCMDEKGKVTSYSLKVGKYYITSLDGKTLEHTDSIQELDCSGSVVATPESCFTVEVNNGEATITDYVCSETDVVIPKTVQDGIKVTSIGGGAFEKKQLTSVAIPDSVASIRGRAFFDNQLINIEIPNSVIHIGEDAFAGNQLTSVVIPDSITSIEGYVFQYNQLTSVVIPDSVTSIGSSAFEDNKLTSVVIPDSVIEISEFAFYNNQLTSVEIPNSLTSVGYRSFGDNQLTSVTIHNTSDNVRLGTGAFGWASGYSDDNINWAG